MGGRGADAKQLASDHADMKLLLAKLRAAPKNAPGWLKTVQMLDRLLAAHIREEEDNIFPALHQHLSMRENTRLTRKMNKEGLKLA